MCLNSYLRTVVIKNNKIKSAKCFADLQSSNYFDDTKLCLSDQACSNYIRQDVISRAPALISGKNLDFTYYPIKDGKRECANLPKLDSFEKNK